MRSFIPRLTIAAIFLCIPVSATFAQDPGEGYVIADAIIGTRTLSQGPLMVDRNTRATMFETTSSLSVNWIGAPRITAGAYVFEEWSAEVSLFGFYDWHGRGDDVLTARTAPIAALPFPGVAMAFAPGDTQRYDYASRLTNAELNVRRHLGDNLSVLAGVRYVNVHEQLSGELYRSNTAFLGNWLARTENNLIGPQIGFDWGLPITCRLGLAATGKFGLFGASENQTTAGSFFAAGTPGERRASAEQIAYLGEMGLKGTYQFSESATLYMGYNVLWLGGVATAPNQLTASNFAPGGAANISTGGNIFVHGAFAGMEFRW